jgi:hypothetical protein
MAERREHATDDLLLHMAVGAFMGGAMAHSLFGVSRTEGVVGGLVKGVLAGALLGGGATVAEEEVRRRWWQKEK